MGHTAYEAPEVRDFGSLQELTQQTYNKIGQTPDMYTAITNGAVIGSLVPTP